MERRGGRWVWLNTGEEDKFICSKVVEIHPLILASGESPVIRHLYLHILTSGESPVIRH